MHFGYMVDKEKDGIIYINLQNAVKEKRSSKTTFRFI